MSNLNSNTYTTAKTICLHSNKMGK